MLFYVKKLLTYKTTSYIKIVQTACMVYVCLHALARFNQINGQLYFFFSYSGGGLQWFAVVCGDFPASSLVTLPIVPNSGGDL